MIVSRECEFCSVFSMCRSNIRNIIKTWVLLVIIRGVDAVSNYAWKLFVLLRIINVFFFFLFFFFRVEARNEDFFAFLFVFSVAFFLDFHYWFPTSRIVCLLTSVSFRRIFEPRCNLRCNRIRDGVLTREVREKKMVSMWKFFLRKINFLNSSYNNLIN